MGRWSNYKTGLLTAIFLFVLAFSTALISYRAYNSSKKVETTYERSFQVLKQDISRIESRIQKLDNNLKVLQANFTKADLQPKTRGAEAIMSGVSIGQISPKSEVLMQLKKILESDTLERLIALQDIDPDVLQEIYDKHTDQKDIENYIEDLRGINREQHKADEERYGEELNSLYDRARFRRGRSINDEEREKAFNEMIEKYPDSYATSMVIAQYALISARRRDLKEAEKYYSMLMNSGNKETQNVVLDMGFEAMPNIEHSLAWLYYREGRAEESKLMAEYIEENRSGSFVFVRGPQPGPPSLKPVSEAISRFRRITGFQN